MNKYFYLLIAIILSLFAGGKWTIPLAEWIAPIFVLRFYRQSDKPGRDFILLCLASALPPIISWTAPPFFPLFAEFGFFLAVSPISFVP